MAAELFLQINGWRLDAADTDCVLVVLALAGGAIDEPMLAAWLRERVAPR